MTLDVTGYPSLMSSRRPALLVIDMLNTYDHEDAEALVGNVEKVVPAISGLLDEARDSDTDVVFVNDNYGDWNSSAEELSRNALGGRRPDLVEPILPGERDSFVIKARHTVFYMTPVEYLLRQAEVDHIVLTGQVTEQCILYSALDAYVRHFQVTVATDAVAAIHDDLGDAALQMMERNMSAELRPSAEVLG